MFILTIFNYLVYLTAAIIYIAATSVTLSQFYKLLREGETDLELLAPENKYFVNGACYIIITVAAPIASLFFLFFATRNALQILMNAVEEEKERVKEEEKRGKEKKEMTEPDWSIFSSNN